MISQKHSTIFVHIPKVAGQSIETMFLNDHGLNWDTRSELLLRKKKPTEKGPFRLAHLKAKEYVQLGYINQENFESYFKFSFVRNPYSRAYSYYKYLGYANIISYRDFLKYVLRKKVSAGHFFFIPQTDYLYSDDDQLLVNFVGKFERINEDIQHVIQKSNLDVKTLPHVNKSKNELNRGISKIIRNPLLLTRLKTKNKIYRDYREAYDQECMNLVQDLYSSDLDNFQYEFDPEQ